MSSRIILPYKRDFIKKIVPTPIKGDWPKLGTLDFDTIFEDLEPLLANCKMADKYAILQQYGEFWLWMQASEYEREALAPLLHYYNSPYTNLPVLIFPRFTPLLRDNEAVSLNDRNSLVVLGMRAQELGYSAAQVKDFIARIEHLCNSYHVCEEDILSNLSNIGYSRIYGLRVIDYGLTNFML